MNPRRLRDLVVETAAEVLGAAPADLATDGTLTAFATYTSFRVLDIVESLERRLGTEVEADDLVPANLRHVDSLCRLFGGGAPAAGPGTAAAAAPATARTTAPAGPTAPAGAASVTAPATAEEPADG